jgi:hypothetical protein
MPDIRFKVSEAEKEVLKNQKDALGVTWKEALLRGLAMGPTQVEKMGLPNPIKEAAVADMRDNEFLEELREAQADE